MKSLSLNNPIAAFTAHWRDYLETTKPKVVLLLVFTAMVGMALAVPAWPPLQEAFFGSLGIGLASASAAAINHVIDQRIDAEMGRTKNRPLPQGSLTTHQCLMFAFSLGIIAMLILVLLVNVLTAVLTFLSLIGYAVVYTVYLKRATPQNIVIGGAAGAMPPVLGWAAVTAAIVSYRVYLDTAALLGFGDSSSRRLCQSRYPHAAGNAWRCIYATTNFALYHFATDC